MLALSRFRASNPKQLLVVIPVFDLTLEALCPLFVLFYVCSTSNRMDYIYANYPYNFCYSGHNKAITTL